MAPVSLWCSLRSDAVLRAEAVALAVTRITALTPASPPTPVVWVVGVLFWLAVTIQSSERTLADSRWKCGGSGWGYHGGVGQLRPGIIPGPNSKHVGFERRHAWPERSLSNVRQAPPTLPANAKPKFGPL